MWLRTLALLFLLAGPAGKASAVPAIDENSSFEGKYFRLIHFSRLPSDAERRQMAAWGVRLVDYRHPMAYYAVVDAAFDNWKAVPALRKVMPVPLSMKYNPVWDERTPEWAYRKEGVGVVVAYYKGLNPDRVRVALEKRGMQVERVPPFAYQIEGTIPADQVHAFAGLPFVQYVDLPSPPPVPEENNYDYSGINRSNVVHHLPGKDYRAAGIRMMVSESGRVARHMNLKGRLWVWDSTSSVAGHSSSVARFAASAAVTDPTSDAPAPGATIISDDFPTSYDQNYTNHQVLYTNHSLGFGIHGGYDARARALDLLTEQYPEVAVFFSAGNSGTSTGFSPYSFAGWANITGERKQNKNHFASGSVSPTGQFVSLSSRGPMYDGRLYPLVVNEGAGGTSYSSPKTMGSAALLQDVWKDHHNDSLAPAVLLRAVIALTADDILNPGPDYKSGFGLVNMRRAYEVVHQNQVIIDSVSNGQTDSFMISVPQGLHEFRVMLMWPDPAAPIGAVKGLINDLDVEVIDPNGQLYHPWVLNHYPDPDSLDDPAVRKVDTLNNAELVTIDSPTAGTWKVRVKGSHVPMGPQTYYVAYEHLQPGLTLTFPHEGAAFIDDDDIIIYWDYYGPPGTFSLKYQLDGGSWQTIANNVAADRRAYQWTPLPVSPGLHTLRVMVQRGALTDTSAIATITAMTPSDLVSECTPRQVSWQPSLTDTAYRLLYLDSVRMRVLDSGVTITGTSAVVTALPPDQYYMTVAAERDGYIGYWAIPARVNLSASRYTYPLTKGFENDPLESPELTGGWTVTPSPAGYTWLVNSGSTPSSSTGPTAAAVGKQYLYTEASISNASNDETTLLTSPCIDEGGGYLSFYYHMYGSQMGNLYIEGWDSASGVWTVFDSLMGEQQLSGSAWMLRRVLVGGLTAPYRVRFRAVRGSGYRSDIAIDSISLYPATKQLSVLEVLSPRGGCGLGANEPLVFVLTNPAIEVHAGDTIAYTVMLDGQQVCQQTIYAPRDLAFADTLHVHAPCTLDVSAVGVHALEIRVTIDDSTVYTAPITTQPLIAQLPYYQDFENGTDNWLPQAKEGSASSWEWGNPAAGGNINTAASGSMAWETRLGDGYDDKEAGWVLSPCFDLSALGGDQVLFEAAVWWDAERGYDGGAVDTLTSMRRQWGRLGTVSIAQGWYNDPGIDGLAWSGSQKGWTGTASDRGSQGWVTARWIFDMPDTTGYIQFRVLFGSDYSIHSGDGFAFDDVRIGVLGSDIMVDSTTLSPVLECDKRSKLLPVKARLINMGKPLSAGDMLSYEVRSDQQTVCQGTAPLGTALGTGDTTMWEIPGCQLTFHDSTHQVEMRVTLNTPTEADTSDNRYVVTVWVPPLQTLPYREGFEQGRAGWKILKVGDTTSWTWGSPTVGTINKAYEGAKVWKTSLGAGYLDDEAGYVLSPCFVIPDAIDSFRFSAGVWWDTYRTYDGGAIDIYQNGQWHHMNGAFPQYWFTGPVSALEKRWGYAHRYGWTGQSHFWKQVSTRINTPSADTIQLRFVFAVDGPGPATYDGLAFDDVRLTPLYPAGLGKDPAAGWKIYPVPATDALWIQTARPPRQVVMRLYAPDGKQVWMHRLPHAMPSPWRVSLPPRLAAGTYLLRIITPDGVVHQRVMIAPR